MQYCASWEINTVDIVIEVLVVSQQTYKVKLVFKLIIMYIWVSKMVTIISQAQRAFDLAFCIPLLNM